MTTETDSEHVLRHGYSITREWCGQPTQRLIVRQYGKWVSHHGSRVEARAAIRARGGVPVR